MWDFANRVLKNIFGTIGFHVIRKDEVQPFKHVHYTIPNKQVESKNLKLFYNNSKKIDFYSYH